MSSTANENFNKELEEEIRSDEDRIQVRAGFVQLQPPALKRAAGLWWRRSQSTSKGCRSTNALDAAARSQPR